MILSVCLILVILSPIFCDPIKIGKCLLAFDACKNGLVDLYVNTKYGLDRLDLLEPVLPGYFNGTKGIKILIHGYGGLKIDKATVALIEAYQNSGYDFLLVDWSVLAKLPCYPASAINTWSVGQCVGKIIGSLLNTGISAKKFHLIGFSLGAHLASFASNHVEKNFNAKIGRLTGLDPALPFFATFRKDLKLDQNDADFVDVYHTSGGSFGKIEASGDVDFYINGGISQPICKKSSYPLLCSHIMAGIYFAKTITKTIEFAENPCQKFTFFPCTKSISKKLTLGENIDQRNLGSFYVETSLR